jgi:hypothetical protein
MTDSALASIDRRVIIFTGNYGSGKTEVSVNFTLALAAETSPLSIVDLDIVNPYFRCREAVQPLEAAGVEVIVPRGETFASELPIILPEVKGAILRDTGRVVLDVGGDNVGARVLAGFAAALDPERAELLMVLNARRPFTDTVEGSVQMIREIEQASRLKVGGLVCNTHLMEETTADMVREGVDLAVEVGEAVSAPLRFIAVMEEVADRLEEDGLPAPVLRMQRRLLPPWLSPLRQGRDRFRQVGLDS